MNSPRVAVEPLVFEHPEEMRKGADSAAGYWTVADRRIFAVMAFLNVAGYDEEAPNVSMSPLRVKVRDKLASRLAGQPAKLEEWRRYYDAHRRGALAVRELRAQPGRRLSVPAHSTQPGS